MVLVILLYVSLLVFVAVSVSFWPWHELDPCLFGLCNNLLKGEQSVKKMLFYSNVARDLEAYIEIWIPYSRLYMV